MILDTTTADEDITSERVTFQCGGCGRDTIVHVGRRSAMTRHRCVRCANSPSEIAPLTQAARVGTHQRRVQDVDLRARRRAKALRASKRHMGQPFRKSCHSYGCTHRKHSVAKGS